MSDTEFKLALWCNSNFDIITDRYPYCKSKYNRKYINLYDMLNIFELIK